MRAQVAGVGRLDWESVPTVEIRLGPSDEPAPLLPTLAREIWSAPLDALTSRHFAGAGQLLIALAAKLGAALGGEATNRLAVPAGRWRVPDSLPSIDLAPETAPMVVSVDGAPLCVSIARRELSPPGVAGETLVVLAVYVPTTTPPEVIRRVYAAICAATGES